MNKSSDIANTKQLSPTWTKAAVIGGIWAAIEIIAGSFLHNLKVPFSGTILSMVAVFMLVAFSLHWKERGVILRAGLIAALMKSISPSAIILGPMIGIIMEALIIEFILFLLGRNLAGYIVAGILAVTWTLLQKIISLLILYGFNLVKIVNALYQFLLSKTGLEQLSPLILILLILGIYCLAGGLSALAGYASFRRNRKTGLPVSRGHIEDQTSSLFGGQTSKQRFAIPNLLLIIIVLSSVLFCLNKNIYIPAIVAGTSLIIFILIRYKRSIRYLKKASIWIQLLLITFVSALVWEWISSGELFTMHGLWIGLEINFRALVIIFSFSALSVELRNPVVRSLLYRNGFSNLYLALNLSFSILPTIIDRLPKTKNLFKKRSGFIILIIHLSEELYAYLNTEPEQHNNIFLLTGEVQSGKSQFLQKFVELCKMKHLTIGGFIAEGTFKDNKRFSFQFRDLKTNNSIPLACAEKQAGWFKYRRFYFNPEAFSTGVKILSEAIKEAADIIVLDELGPMELEGKGWRQALTSLEKNFIIPQVWVVRKRILREVKNNWQIPARNVYSIEERTPEDLYNNLMMQKAGDYE